MIYKDMISKYFDIHMDEIFESLKEIMSIDSSLQPAEREMPFGKGSAKALKWSEDFGKRLGMKVKNFDNYAVSMDFKEGEPTLGILSHLDVVPASGEGWSYPPFDCTVDNGIIYGRGAIDDKGPSVAVLYAVKCIKDLNIPIKDNFRIIFGGNEEGGCQDIEYYEKQEKFPPMVFTPDGTFPVLNCEKGMIHLTFSAEFHDAEVDRVEGGTVINAVPEHCSVKFSGKESIFKGVPAHGSRPENGENAITKWLAGYSGSNPYFNGLKKLFPHGEYNGKSAGLGFSDKISGEMTCALTLLNYDGKKLIGGIDIRFPIDRKLKEITDIITASLNKFGIKIEKTEGMEPHYVPEDSPFVQTLLEVYRDVMGEEGECIAEGGITYVHNTEGGVAFGAEFPYENNNMHGIDEHMSVETLKYNLNMYTNAIIKICGVE